MFGITPKDKTEKAALSSKAENIMEVLGLKAWYGSCLAVKGIDLAVHRQAITAIIGPSGCGKSTFIRCLNRLHEVSHGGRTEGSVLLDGEDIYAPGVDPVAIRRRIGMVFQKPNPFPTMSVFDNVVSGLRLARLFGQSRDLHEAAERSLRSAALWDEVKDKLRESGASLSGGQQQRLCIARALAVEPEVILLDEPASALDPISTAAIEDLMHELKRDYTLVIVTHNMQQAARVADMTAFFSLEEIDGDRAGILVEYDETAKIFTHPTDPRTEGYVTGRFG